MTNGFLPAAPFHHLDPTAVGVLDLESPTPVSVVSESTTTYRDAMLLVRLHREPLGFLHTSLSGSPGETEALLALATDKFAQRIRRHTATFGCTPASRACRHANPPPLAGSAAVIIPTGGRPEQLDRCLRSLVPNLPDDVELSVVDNRPQAPETRALISQWQDRDARVRYVAEVRPGSSVARNRGVAESKAEFVAFTDDDVVIDATWLHWLLAPFGDPQVNAATGLVLPLELATIAQKRFEQYAGFSKGIDRRIYDATEHAACDRLLYPYWGGVFGSGNSMAFRRADLVAAGGFDPALGAGSLALAGADIEAMSAVILRGGRLVYEPRSLCWHEHRRDDASLRRQLFNYGVGFTAILTKAMMRDRRFPVAVMRSIPVALRARRRRAAGGRASAAALLPADLARLQRKGMLRGPLLYRRSMRWAKQLQLDEVIRGS